MIKEYAAKLKDINTYDVCIEMCRKMLLKLKDDKLFSAHTKKDQPYNDALVDMLLYHPANIERYITEDYDEIRYRSHEQDKKGKLIRCEAYFAKRVQGYKDVTKY